MYETTLPFYEDLKQALSEFYPAVTVELISDDPMLKKLGFSDEIPCVIRVKATEEQIEEIKHLAIQTETDAYDTPDGELPAEDDPYYIRFLKYGWLFDFFEYDHIARECDNTGRTEY